MPDPSLLIVAPAFAPLFPTVIDLALVLCFAFEIAPLLRSTLDALAFVLHLLVEI